MKEAESGWMEVCRIDESGREGHECGLGLSCTERLEVDGGR